MLLRGETGCPRQLDHKRVVVQMCVSCVNIPTELDSVNQQPNDDIVHLFQLGKTDSLAG